jgi:CRISPR/Cas system CMR subunit Cmr4 (Cas7 group RAMP superfamily)
MAIKDNYFYRNEYKDMEKMFLYFDKKLSELAQVLDKMQKQAQQQQQEGQQGNGSIPPEMQEKFRLDRIKLKEKLETARMRTENAQALRQKQFEFDNELKKKKLEEELNNKKAIAQNQVELEQLKAAGKMAV